MALRNLAETLIRIAGIFLALNMTTIGFVLMGFSQGHGKSIVYGWIMFSLIVLPSLVMIFAPSKIVGTIMCSSTEEKQIDNEELKFLFEVAQPIFLSLAGLYFFVTGGINCLSYGLSWMLSNTSELKIFLMPSMVLTAILQFIVGLYLLFGAKGFLKLLLWLRNIHPEIK